MKQVAVTIKIDDELKADIQKLAKNMGLSFSAIVENKLREAARERRIVFEEQLTPNKKFAKHLREVRADVAANHNVSPTFDSAKELFDYLDDNASD